MSIAPVTELRRAVADRLPDLPPRGTSQRLHWLESRDKPLPAVA